ncbi:glycosyltransferase [Georgenia muralis]|nr:glycosyltransferase [Georgenia muralis]
MTRRGHEVRTVAARRWDVGGTAVTLEPEPGEDAVGVATVGTHPALFLYDPRPLWRALGEDWDVIDLHEEPFALATAEVLLLRALRRHRAPYVLYSAQNLDKRYPPPFRWLERRALAHASGVSVCNEEAGRIVERKGFPGRAEVIPLGLDTTLFRPAGAAASVVGRGGVPVPEARPVDVDRVHVGYVGRLASHKGVDVVLTAVAQDPRLTLRVCGTGPEEASLRSRAAELGVTDRVDFAGHVAQAELPALYRSVDVVAVPSRTTPSWVEQFGRVAVEAMACGVPVVASSSGALPDVVGGAGLLVPPGDAAELSRALLAAGLDADLRRTLVRSGLERARRCDWEVVADRYEALYRRAIGDQVSAEGGAAGQELADETAPPVEVVVVAYGTPELLRRALAPLISLSVTVVDNSSLPEIRALCEKLGARYLDPGRNGGFAAGVNHALGHRSVPGGDLLLLNPDAVVTREDVTALRRALHADPRLASVGPAQVDGQGRPARVGWPFPHPARSWLEAVGLGRLGRQTGFVIGSVLLLRAEALAQVGGFDERFFLYAEETDWAYRAARLGWRHAVVPGVRATHLGAATSADAGEREVRFHASQERYYRKHFGAAGWQANRAARVLGAAARSLVTRAPNRDVARRRLGLYLRGPVAAERSSSAGGGP